MKRTAPRIAALSRERGKHVDQALDGPKVAQHERKPYTAPRHLERGVRIAERACDPFELVEVALLCVPLSAQVFDRFPLEQQIEP